MKELTISRPPAGFAARLKPEEAACLIGCQPHDIPVLVRVGLLKPLGRPAPNGVKYFSHRRLTELCAEDTWLARVSDALVQHWQRKNQRRGQGESLSRGLTGNRTPANPQRLPAT